MAPLQGTRNVLLPHTNSGRMSNSTPRNRTMNHINASFSNGNLSPRVNVSNHSNDLPVEVVGRIRDFPDRKDSQQRAFEMVGEPNEEETTVRVKTEIGYRDFSLDGISLAEKEDLDGFYKTFIENRVYGVKTGEKCTIIMYGPTGSGKSHTMFGCSKEPGIVYRALNHILGDQENEDGVFRHRLKVKVSVLEIYNEDIFDLLATSNMPNIGWFKNGQRRIKLEVMGKKVKNATSISGSEAGKINKEIVRVEKRRVVKTTLCNHRSSRSHCLVIIDVPAVGGRLVLVDMAGSENIDQAGSVGPEAKMQTGRINQGNMALKRVVESIANGDSHVPYRDSKLTILLQDPSGAPIARESEASFPVTFMPTFPNQRGSYIACLRLCTQQVTAMYPGYTGEPLGSPKDQLAVRTPVQASPSSPWVSPAQKKVFRTSNQSASSRGK